MPARSNTQRKGYNGRNPMGNPVNLGKCAGRGGQRGGPRRQASRYEGVRPDLEKALEWLDLHWKGNRHCAVCENTDWGILDEAVEMRAYNEGRAVIGGSIFPSSPYDFRCAVVGSTNLRDHLRVRNCHRSRFCFSGQIDDEAPSLPNHSTGRRDGTDKRREY